MLVEVCANSIESARVAEQAGANRIELCSELAVGGVTPSFGMIEEVLKKVSIPVHILIRPRSGNFTYTADEIKVMLSDIECAKKMGVSGIVSGVLKNDFTLDYTNTKVLIEASEGLKFTFHRAFDWVHNPFETMRLLQDLGVDYILSSGQQASAVAGLPLLDELHKTSEVITIMPGAGITASNAHLFKEKGFTHVHLSGTAMIDVLSQIPKVSMNSLSFLSDTQIAVTQQQAITSLINKVK